MVRRTPVVAVSALAAVALVLVVAAQGQIPLQPARDVGDRSWTTAHAAPDLPAGFALTYGPGLAMTPPMGWNPFNRFGREATEGLVMATARAMVASGMARAGYSYVNLDGGWDTMTRSSDGELQPDPHKFPHGIQALAGFVHSLGLKFGIYASAGYQNCARTSAGSYGHYRLDAETFARWGVDYVKLDWCHIPFASRTAADRASESLMLARAFGGALAATGRPMVLDVNDTRDEATAGWARGLGNLWRTAPDIRDSYASMLANFRLNVAQYSIARADHWNDPDMLEIGNGSMTWTEYQAEFSLWAEMSAPLIVGADLRNMRHEMLAMLTNPSVIAVDQDQLGVQGYPITSRGGLWVLTKPLLGGDRAVVLFNTTDRSVTMSTTATAIGLSPSAAFQLRDLWSGATSTTDGAFSAVVAPHGVVMYQVGPVA